MKLAQDGLNELTEALKQGHSETLKRFLEVAARFPRYSFRNVMLIAFQRPDATRVAGFQTWKSLGRYVLKGEAGIGILAPLVGRQREQDEKARRDSDDEAIFGFRVVHVFDISQTEGEPLPGFAELNGDPHDRLQVLEQVVRDSGIELDYAPLPGSTDGMSCKGKIIIRPSLAPRERFAVLVHEFAHELLHQRDLAHRPSKTVRETEAEAVAHIVCHAFGIDTTTHSSDYIQLYDGNADTLTGSLQAIQTTAAKIIEDISGDESQRETGITVLAA